MADDRDFNDASEVYGYSNIDGSITTNNATVTSTGSLSANSTLGITGTTYNAVPYYSTWCGTPRRELVIKFSHPKILSNTEYYEEVHKLMLLLKESNWNITSTKVKS